MQREIASLFSVLYNNRRATKIILSVREPFFDFGYLRPIVILGI